MKVHVKLGEDLGEVVRAHPEANEFHLPTDVWTYTTPIPAHEGWISFVGRSICERQCGLNSNGCNAYFIGSGGPEVFKKNQLEHKSGCFCEVCWARRR